METFVLGVIISIIGLILCVVGVFYWNWVVLVVLCCVGLGWRNL